MLAQIDNLLEIYCEHEIFSQTNLCGTLLGGLGWHGHSITSFLRTTQNCKTFSTAPFAKHRHYFFGWEHPYDYHRIVQSKHNALHELHCIIIINNYSLKAK